MEKVGQLTITIYCKGSITNLNMVTKYSTFTKFSRPVLSTDDGQQTF